MRVKKLSIVLLAFTQGGVATVVRAHDSWLITQVMRQQVVNDTAGCIIVLTFDAGDETEGLLTHQLQGFCRRLLLPAFDVTLLMPNAGALW